MLNKANEAATGNSPLFAFINQPLKRTSPKTTRSKTAPLAGRGAVMAFNRAPEPTPAEAKVVDTDDLSAFARPVPIQLFITYTDRNGLQQKLHVVPWHDLHTQDMELQATIKQIVRDGGRKLQMDVIHVPTGVCVSRWVA